MSDADDDDDEEDDNDRLVNSDRKKIDIPAGRKVQFDNPSNFLVYYYSLIYMTFEAQNFNPSPAVHVCNY